MPATVARRPTTPALPASSPWPTSATPPSPSASASSSLTPAGGTRTRSELGRPTCRASPSTRRPGSYTQATCALACGSSSRPGRRRRRHDQGRSRSGYTAPASAYRARHPAEATAEVGGLGRYSIAATRPTLPVGGWNPTGRLEATAADTVRGSQRPVAMGRLDVLRASVGVSHKAPQIIGSYGHTSTFGNSSGPGESWPAAWDRLRAAAEARLLEPTTGLAA